MLDMALSIKPNPGVPFEIRFADEHLLVIEKHAGVVTTPGKGHERDSLLNGLFTDYGHALQNLGEDRDWGMLHRLDKGTSGLVVVALRNATWEHLLEQFKQRQIKKLYWALVMGRPDPAQGVIQKAIAEVVSTTRKKAVLSRDGQAAITAYKVLDEAGGISLIEARPKTGRLHQIRVHMASLECPVLGDDIYAGKAKLPRVPRLCLHAAQLSFIHPATGHRMTVSSPWPSDLKTTLKRFGLSKPGTDDARAAG